VLSYATYLGGGGFQAAAGIAVDASGNAYVIGRTDARNFPITPGVVQTKYGGGSHDVFVAKLNSTGTALEGVCKIPFARVVMRVVVFATSV